MSQTIDNQVGDCILQPGKKYYLCRNQIFADPELIDFVRDIRHIGGVNMHTLLETYDIQVVNFPSSQEQDFTRRYNHAGRLPC